MSTRPFMRIGPIARLTVGLVALGVSLLMTMDLAFDAIPDRERAQRQLRQRFAESLAVQVASLTEAGDHRTLNRTLQQVVTRNPDVLSVAIRQVRGYLIAQQGNHARHWVSPDSGRSTPDHVRVPILADRERWGDVELAFVDATPRGLRGWAAEPLVLLVSAFVIGGMLIFYPYLRRALQFLDPSAAVPDRVRKAFDTLSGGVVAVDPDGHIVLANTAFRRFHPDGSKGLHGRKLAELEWLMIGGDREGKGPIPWDKVFHDGKPISGYPLSIPRPDGQAVETIVACSPIADSDGRVRGCLVAFDDVTELHRTNVELRGALADLERSREKIQAQNEELQRLATRDPLTGVLNRRAFFGATEDLFAERLRSNGELACMMVDIDHFKAFNDLYGHSIGDQVIQVVARTLSRMLRADDLLCRYGGEEFAIVLPDTELSQAALVAERLRCAIETGAVSAIRSTQVRTITASFGVASLSQGAIRLEELIDQADNALYRSKEGGRNRVTVWESPDD